jgi:hypothetical protein
MACWQRLAVDQLESQAGSTARESLTQFPTLQFIHVKAIAGSKGGPTQAFAQARQADEHGSACRQQHQGRWLIALHVVDGLAQALEHIVEQALFHHVSPWRDSMIDGGGAVGMAANSASSRSGSSRQASRRP